MTFFAAIGALVIAAFGELGRMSIFAIRGGFAWLAGPFYWRAFASMVLRIGFNSLPVVGLTAIFTGAALALNIYDGSATINAAKPGPSSRTIETP
ncbi:MAG: ABC transporter permease, partial [Pseudomonadota bacterium]